MHFKPCYRLMAAAALTAAAASASATSLSFEALLNGAEVVPVNTTATGTAFVTFDDAALTVSVHETFVGLTGGSATASHIHCCTAPPAAAPVFLPFTGFPSGTSGTYNNTFSLSAASFATLLAGTEAGDAYVNIHDATYPAGEIRGFLQAVPEPGIYGMLLVGLGGIVFVTRRRKGR